MSNNQGDFNAFIHSMLMKQAMKDSLAKAASNIYKQHNPTYEYLERDPQIKTSITDVDMLFLHIDMALDNGDAELFMRLTEGLKGLEVGI